MSIGYPFWTPPRSGATQDKDNDSGRRERPSRPLGPLCPLWLLWLFEITLCSQLAWLSVGLWQGGFCMTRIWPILGPGPPSLLLSFLPFASFGVRCYVVCSCVGRSVVKRDGDFAVTKTVPGVFGRWGLFGGYFVFLHCEGQRFDFDLRPQL